MAHSGLSLHPFHTGKDETDAVSVRPYVTTSRSKKCSHCGKAIKESRPELESEPCDSELCSNCLQSQGYAHPAHIQHFLFLVNLMHEIWTCNGCNKSSTQIKETVCYFCDVCKFYLCRSCFKPKKYLLHGHDLTKTDVRCIYHQSHGRWKCDCCGGNNGPDHYLPRHCKICKFDLCEKCCQPQQSSLHLHELCKADTTLVYERFAGGWRCDYCETRFHPLTNKFPFHCNICEFDLCDKCMRLSSCKVAPRPLAHTRSGIATTAGGFPVTSPEEELACLNIREDPVDDSALCIVCMAKPKDATIVHGLTGHVCCCLQCAKKLERRGDPCPICREPIQLVIEQFLV